MPKNDAPEPGSTQDSASFLRRLAGPSIMKAGLAKDQTEINKIIAEASKGSKFYENEKRKDKDLTERIERLLKQRDDALRGADIAKIEASVDHLLEKMEACRDLTQIIVHVDMDAFYASVELLDDPSLEGKPFAVGHGVVSTASYEARKQGVRSGMAEFIARKLCPDLIVVSTHFPRYMDISNKVMDIFRRYDPNMQPGGCDEGYLNITEYCETHLVSADECVREMRDVVHKETRLTVSAGIAPNKMLAKICSDKNKPNGQFMLEFTPEAVKAFMHDLPIRKVPGVGRVNERLLDSIGIKNCGDIYKHRAVVSLMDKQFGLTFLLQTYLGIASNVVQPLQREERKSIGAERTFHSIGDKEQILAKLEEVAAELEEDMERTGWTGKTVTLKYKLDTYQVFTRAKSFDRWISTTKEDLFAVGKELLMPELPLKLRLIGLRVTKLKDLRQNAEGKPGSIKRFFESATVPASPRKRRRVAEDEPSEEDDPTLSQDGYEECMPNEHDNGEDTTEDTVHEDELTVMDLNQTVVSNPESTRSGEVNRSRSTSLKPVTRPKNDSTGDEKRQETATSHVCPICSKTLQTDNQGLNAHIDFCLSKGAILEAQAAASGGTVRKIKPTASSTLQSWTKRASKKRQ